MQSEIVNNSGWAAGTFFHLDITHPVITGKRRVYIMTLNVYSGMSNYNNKEKLFLSTEQSKI